MNEATIVMQKKIAESSYDMPITYLKKGVSYWQIFVIMLLKTILLPTFWYLIWSDWSNNENAVTIVM